MRPVELKTTTGLARRRAGIHVAATWGLYEVDDEQFAALQADKRIEVREPKGALARRVAQAEEAAGTAQSDLDATMAELARTASELTEACEMLVAIGDELQATVAKLKAAVAEGDQLRAQVVDLEARIASGPTATLEQIAPDVLAIANGELRARVEQLEAEIAALRGAQTPTPSPAPPAPPPPPAQGGKKGKG
jgi:chromosome segregation ATPase